MSAKKYTCYFIILYIILYIIYYYIIIIIIIILYIIFMLFYLRHNYTTDGVTCGKHYEEYVKHRKIANSEKRKSRKQHEINIAEKCKI